MLGLTRTPLRVSLFGGGTDYPAYFQRQPGAVVGFAINRYIYISALKLQGAQDYNYRIAYSKLERVNAIGDIEHPIVREVLNYWGVEERLDLSVQSDFPAGSGLGSSSAFTVGFVNLVGAIFGRRLDGFELARMATYVEQDLLHENVGIQDQLHTALGGLNRFDFHGEEIRATPVKVSDGILKELNRSLVLVHSGLVRRASDAAATKISAISSGKSDAALATLYAMVGDCVGLLESRKDIVPELGRLLDEGWTIKQSLSPDITNDAVNALYATARRAGAYGGKLCGAGGGGAVVLLIDPDRLHELEAALAPYVVVPIEIDHAGSIILQAEAPAEPVARRGVVRMPAAAAE